MTDEIVSPYKEMELNTRVAVHPRQLCTRLEESIRTNLRSLEGRCVAQGNVRKVLKVLYFDNGAVPAEDMERKAYFNVRFSAVVCNPVVGTLLVMTIKKVDLSFVFSENGPVVGYTHVSTPESRLTVKNGFVFTADGSGYQQGDQVVTRVLASRVLKGEKNVQVFCTIVRGIDSEASKQYIEGM